MNIKEQEKLTLNELMERHFGKKGQKLLVGRYNPYGRYFTVGIYIEQEYRIWNYTIFDRKAYLLFSAFIKRMIKEGYIIW